MTKMTKIRQKYGCKGDVLLNTAIQMLMEAGTENLKDEDYMRGIMNHVNAKHDKAERQGKCLCISREFEVALWECAAELATLELPEILAYIQTEMCWFATSAMSYQRARELLNSCVDEYLEGYYEDCLDALERIGFHDEEIEQVGYGYLLEMEEEDDEDY